MENLVYSLSSVLPLFIMILLGLFLRRKGLITDSFVSIGTKIVFSAALPVLLFRQIAPSNLTEAFNPRLVLFGLSSTLVVILLLCLIVPRFIKDRATAGAFIQGVYRGNFAILGVPLAINMFGQEGALPTSLMLPFAVPLYNAMAVVILTVFSPEEGQKISIVKILKGIVTNPLIIGIALGLVFSLCHIPVPKLLDKCLEPVSSLCTPLALLCLGGQITGKSMKENFKLSILAAAIKLIVIPAIVLPIAIAFGFRKGDLGAIFILFMAPTAVASFVMAKTMHSNDDLAGEILVLTTLLSSLTLFLGIFILKTLGFL